MVFMQKIAHYRSENRLPEKTARILFEFFRDYLQAVKSRGFSEEEAELRLDYFLSLVVRQIEAPFSFGLFHQKITEPFDYYHFGLEMIRPLLIQKDSQVFGLENVDRIQDLTAQGSNVILFANHQTEPDPQIINLLLENTHRELASKIIFVAGDRVVTDPLAVPFSLGCNLLCIYSKKHIDAPPERKEEKLLHNQRTMKKMQELLSEGGKCIYVAPSGGRDRLNENGRPSVAPFDPNNIEMFYLISRQSKKNCHFFPLSLYTYSLLPPPEEVEKEIGERRHPSASPAYLFFGKEIDMEKMQSTEKNKEERRKARAEMILNLVKEGYEKILTNH